MKIKIIKILLTPRTAAFKIVHLDNKEINDLDAGNMFYWKKRDAIKYINNSVKNLPDLFRWKKL